MSITIPCETIVRFAPIIQRAVDPQFQMLRLEQGLIVATDRKLLVVEKAVRSFQGQCNLRITDAFVEQCRVEANLAGEVTVIPNDMLKFTTVKTSYGWTTTDNLGVWTDGRTDLDRWREVITQCKEPLESAGAGGAMVWSLRDLQVLTAASPSGEVSFERVFNPDQRPTLLRDISVDTWVGCFLPRLSDGVYYPPASLPGWCR